MATPRVFGAGLRRFWAPTFSLLGVGFIWLSFAGRGVTEEVATHPIYLLVDGSVSSPLNVARLPDSQLSTVDRCDPSREDVRAEAVQPYWGRTVPCTIT